uniref:Uncharacterized protein n=1 Tax=Sphaerodactylus townsendi TaxID=933632 RepID=A0ACB8FJ23_9SAUR
MTAFKALNKQHCPNDFHSTCFCYPLILEVKGPSLLMAAEGTSRPLHIECVSCHTTPLADTLPSPCPGLLLSTVGSSEGPQLMGLAAAAISHDRPLFSRVMSSPATDNFEPGQSKRSTGL